MLSPRSLSASPWVLQYRQNGSWAITWPVSAKWWAAPGSALGESKRFRRTIMPSRAAFSLLFLSFLVYFIKYMLY